MADNGGEEASSRGNEWEVVSLTASTYSAAPGPKRVDDDKGNEFIVCDEGTADAMFMSGHFEFQPTELENPPLESDKNEIDNEPKDEGIVANELPIFDMNKSDKKNVEDWNVKELPVPDELTGIQFYDEKGNRKSVRGTEFEEDMGLRGLDLIGKEESIYNSAKFSSYDSEADVSGSIVYDKDAVVAESCDSSQKSLDNHSDVSKPISPTKEVKFNKNRLPCEELWKRRIASLYKNAKEANAYWSIFVAAALMGLVIIGQRWQQNKASNSAT
ncbi:ATG8-interacting protein 2-like [Telopea speciosissima]|uniref:ATG8-interacting protein 2-like n=1 Tax=Telopea speciosissima TaxID=54955 RepID=UPI001CC66B8D|nr:ATG8-interacting protein 2-like [Telopea speciosissima]